MQRWHANRAVVAAPEANVADRSEFAFDLVGVGLEGRTAADLVRRMTIATRDGQIIEDAFLNQRSAQFGEHFLDVEATRDRRRRRTLTGKIAGLEFCVSHKVERFLAVFGTDCQLEAVLGTRAADAVLAEIASQSTAHHLLRVDALGEAGDLNVVQSRWGNCAGAKDIPRNAGRVAAVQHRAANGRAANRVGDDVQRLDQTGDREVVEVNLARDGPAVLVIGIVRPGVTQIALHAQDAAI